MFTRIAIDNYRCFSNFEFVPGRINLLLGGNGSGKSSFFDAIDAVVDLVVQGTSVGDIFPSSSLTRWDKREKQRIALDAEIGGRAYSYAVVIRHDVASEFSTIDHEKVTCDGTTLFEFEDGHVRIHRALGPFPAHGDRSFLALVDDEELTLWKSFMHRVWSIRLDTRTMKPSSTGDHEALDRDGANFASWYRHLSQENPESLEPLWSSLRPVITGFQSLKLVKSGRSKRDLTVVMKTSGVSYEVDFDELSDGQRALIVLYTLILAPSPRNGCLMLDEPEAHVSLAEIQPWLVDLCDAYQTEGQIFIISHHPEVIDYMAATQPFSFTRIDGGPVRVHPANFERETGLSASDQIARGFLTDDQA